MNLDLLRVKTNLAFGMPTIILGPKGCGKEYLARKAIQEWSGVENDSIDTDFYSLKLNKDLPLYTRLSSMDFSSEMKSLEDVLLKNPKKTALYTTIESASPQWVAHLLFMVSFRPGVILVGERLDYMPIFNRCDLVRL